MNLAIASKTHTKNIFLQVIFSPFDAWNNLVSHGEWETVLESFSPELEEVDVEGDGVGGADVGGSGQTLWQQRKYFDSISLITEMILVT